MGFAGHDSNSRSCSGTALGSVPTAARKFCSRSAFIAPWIFHLSKPQSQEIVKRYSILISRALKSVKKTVRENYQEHANEVKSSADTREEFMPAPRRPGSAGSQQGARRWSGDPGLPSLPSPPFGYCNAFLGIFFPFFFLSASLELNDISSSAGAAGRLGDSERLEKQQRAAPGSAGKVRAILLENPLGFSIMPAVGSWQCWGWGKGDVSGNTAVFWCSFGRQKVC